MPIRLRDAGGTLRGITRIRMRDAGGTLRTIQRVRMRDAGGTLRTVYTAMSVSLVPPAVSGSDGSSPLIASIDTGTTTVVVNGGTGPYTYSWVRSGFNSPLSWTIDDDEAATTFFSALSVPQGLYEDAFTVTVTDANGVQASRSIIASVANTNTS